MQAKEKWDQKSRKSCRRLLYMAPQSFRQSDETPVVCGVPCFPPFLDLSRSDARAPIRTCSLHKKASNQAFKLKFRLRELTTRLYSAAASAVWMQKKQEMNSLNINLSLQDCL